MNFLKQLFSRDKAPEIHPFYGAYISLDKYKIRLITSNESQEIELESIEVIGIYKFDDFDVNERCWIVLKSNSKNISVTTLAGGFVDLENWILSKPNFNTEQYREIRKSNKEFKETILWKKELHPDFETINSSKGLHYDLNDGIVIENHNEILPWTTYEKLGDLRLVKRGKVDFPNPNFKGYEYYVENPIVFGIKTKKIYTESEAFEKNAKLELPILKFWQVICIGNNYKKGFFEIKNYLDTYFNQKGNENENYSQELSFDYYWTFGEVTVQFFAHSAYAYLTIEKIPDLTRFYTSEYQQNLQLSDITAFEVFPFSVDLYVDYKEITNAVYTPVCCKELLDSENQFLIWKDNKAGFFGFSNQEFTLIINSDRASFLILMVQNFRGSEGRNNLELAFHNKETINIGSVSDTKLFDTNRAKIAAVLNIEVNQYVYDEHY